MSSTDSSTSRWKTSPDPVPPSSEQPTDHGASSDTTFIGLSVDENLQMAQEVLNEFYANVSQDPQIPVAERNKHIALQLIKLVLRAEKTQETDLLQHVDVSLTALKILKDEHSYGYLCLLYTSPSPRDQRGSRMPSSA